MLRPETLEFIKACAREYGVKAIYLFGSALEDEGSANDIDLAVEGITPGKFEDLYRKLFFGLSKPVDLVDLSEDLPIVPLIRARGKIIYGN